MLERIFAAWPRSVRFWMLAVFLIFVFFTGGSARYDAQSLAMLRPVSIVMLGIAFCGLSLDHIGTHKCLFSVACVVISIVLLQITPLPDGLRLSLSSNNLIENIAATTSTTDMVRPLSIAPSMTTNALFALMVPFTVLIFSVQLSREERFALLPVVIVLALASGILGFLQALGSPGGILYFYEITNVESAVGLFANRNHQATLLALLFPMLAVFASASVRSQDQGRVKSIAAMSLAAILVPLLLVTGSRTGLLIGFIGIVSGLFLYKAPVSDKIKKAKSYRLDPLVVIAGLAVVTLGALSILFSRAQAVQRLTGLNQEEDLRFQIWRPIFEFAVNFLPTGSGVGSFSTAYQVYESDVQLGPTMLNQAHNDWLDLILTTGYLGIILAALAAVGFLKLAWLALRSTMKAGSRVQFSRLGAVLTFLVVLAALVDYALRTPIITSVLIIFLIWLQSILEDGSNHKKPASAAPVSRVD